MALSEGQRARNSAGFFPFSPANAPSGGESRGNQNPRLPLQVDDAGLGRLRLQAEGSQQVRQPRQRGLGLAAGPAHHDQVTGQLGLLQPALARPGRLDDATVARIIRVH